MWLSSCWSCHVASMPSQIEKLKSWHWGLVTDIRRVTWTAFAILAMFYYKAWDIWIHFTILFSLLDRSPGTGETVQFCFPSTARELRLVAQRIVCATRSERLDGPIHFPIFTYWNSLSMLDLVISPQTTGVWTVCLLILVWPWFYLC